MRAILERCQIGQNCVLLLHVPLRHTVYFHAISQELGWLGSRVVSVLDSGAERPEFKS